MEQTIPAVTDPPTEIGKQDPQPFIIEKHEYVEVPSELTVVERRVVAGVPPDDWWPFAVYITVTYAQDQNGRHLQAATWRVIEGADTPEEAMTLLRMNLGDWAEEIKQRAIAEHRKATGQGIVLPGSAVAQRVQDAMRNGHSNRFQFPG